MDDDFYRQILFESPIGYAYFKIVCDEDDHPCNMIFLEVNPVFEQLSGLKVSDIIGKYVTEVLPDTTTSSRFDWIGCCGEAAMKGKRTEFEHFSVNLQQWYKVSVFSPEKNYVITQFSNINKEISQMSEIEYLVSLSEDILKSDKDFDYEKVNNEFLKLSEAKYSIFNLYDENGENFVTKSICAEKVTIQKAAEKLGFSAEGKRWVKNPDRAENLKKNIITRYESLTEFGEGVIPQSILYNFERMFDLGEIIQIGICKENIIIGEFILIMEKGKVFNKDIIIKVFIRHLAMAVSRKRAEKHLLQEKQFNEAILQSLPGYFYVYDEAGHLIKWNRKHEEMTGYSSEEMAEMTIDKWFDEKDLIRVDNAIKQVFSTGYGEVEADLRLKNGEKMRINTNGVPLVVDGKSYFVGVGININERLKFEQELKESKERYKSLLEYSGVSISYYDQYGKVIFYNEKAAKNFGGSAEYYTGKSIYDLLSPADAEFTMSRIAKAAECENMQEYEDIIRLETGVKWMHSIYNRITDFNGNTIGVQIVSKDITPRKIAEDEKRKSDEKFSAIFDQSPIAIQVNDAHGNLTSANKAFLELFGVSDLEDVRYFNYINDPSVDDHIKIKLLNHESVFVESEIDFDEVKTLELFTTACSGIKYLDITIKPLIDNKNVIGSITMIRDRTDRKNSERKLIESEEKYRFITENVNDMISKHALDGRYTFVSLSCKRILGYEPDELIGVDPYDLFHPEDIDLVKETHSNIMNSDEILISTYRIRKKDGIYIWFETSNKTIWDEISHEPIEILCVSRDISGRIFAIENRISSQERYSAIFDQSPIAIQLFDSDGWLKSMNNAGLDLLGIKDILELSKLNLFDAPRINNELRIKLQNHQFVRFETTINFDVVKETNLYHTTCSGIMYLDYSVKPLTVNKKVTGYIVQFQDITGRIIAEQEKKSSQEKYSAIFDQSPIAIQIYDAEGKIKSLNNASLKLLGINNIDDITNLDMFDTPGLSLELKMKLHSFESVHFETILNFGGVRKHGIFHTVFTDKKYLDFFIKPLFYDGTLNGYIVQVQDITDRKKAEIEVIESEIKYRNIFAAERDALFLVDHDDGSIMEANDAACSLYGYTQEEFLKLRMVDLSAEPERMEFINGKGLKSISIPLIYHKKKDGTIFPIEVTASKFELNNKKVYISVLRDITERKKNEEMLLYISYHDSMTKLLNRRRYEELLNELDASQQIPISIVVGDVNGLKLINDAFGYSLGDSILKKIAAIMKEECGDQAHVARRGGDEFAILFPGVGFEEASKIIERIKQRCIKESSENYMLNITFGIETKSGKNQKLIQCEKTAEERMATSKLLEGKNIRSSIIENLRMVLEEKTGETRKHCDRMAEMSQVIGKAIGMQTFEIEHLKLMALLHDIGKTAIPDTILLKPGKLNKRETLIMKKHSELGYRIANTIPELIPVAEGILHHHERWDGTGYPQQLTGEDIPLMSRIVAILDSYDAMTNDRTYKKAVSSEDALRIIENYSGTQFDPKIAKIFINYIRNKNTLEDFSNTY